jgi:hypothetical protein
MDYKKLKKKKNKKMILMRNIKLLVADIFPVFKKKKDNIQHVIQSFPDL